jgi:flagellar P-ring protein precursor FlgI
VIATILLALAIPQNQGDAPSAATVAVETSPTPITVQRAIAPAPEGAVLVPIRDLATVRGVRSNQLTGFGLVVGLHGTGDKSNFAKQQIQNLAKTIGLTVNANDLTTDNIAIAVVSATLPPYAQEGQTIDAQVASYGDASSLQGGTLVRTPLTGAVGGDAVAVAQGPLVLGGFSASGSSASVTKNHTTAGSIPRGAMIESGVALARMRPVSEGNFIYLDLRKEEAKTADRMATAINGLHPGTAFALNPGTVRVAVPKDSGEASGKFPAFLTSIQDLMVPAFTRALVKLNEKTSSVFIVGNPRLTPCLIARGNLTITIAESPIVSQPTPFSSTGQTAVVNRTNVNAAEESRPISQLSGAETLSDMARALSLLGATPRELVDILSQLQSTGALFADIEIN